MSPTSRGLQFHAATSRQHLSEAKAELAKYPMGKEVTVYVNPADPAETVLIPGASLEGYAVRARGSLFGLFALIFWILVVVPPKDSTS